MNGAARRCRAPSVTLLPLLARGLATLDEDDVAPGNFTLELGISLWMSRVAVDLDTVHDALLTLREAFLQVSELDVTSEPVPLVVGDRRAAVLSLAIYLHGLVGRAATSKAARPQELAEQALERVRLGRSRPMHETSEDLRALQALLDRSYEHAGPHLQEIITPERRLTAGQVSERLRGMCLLVLATSTADGRPVSGPVDGIFYRGAFHFGSSENSVRMRHIRHRPSVSASHLPNEQFAVTVHGRATLLDLDSQAHQGFRQTLGEVYVPLMGAEWEDFLATGPRYARIDADMMFTFQILQDD